MSQFEFNAGQYMSYTLLKLMHINHFDDCPKGKREKKGRVREERDRNREMGKAKQKEWAGIELKVEGEE